MQATKACLLASRGCCTENAQFMLRHRHAFGLFLLLVVGCASPRTIIRFATFNASLNRDKGGQLAKDLSTGQDAQIKNVAEIIQRTHPDVLLINEFDYDEEGRGAYLFQKNYLAISQNGAPPI